MFTATLSLQPRSEKQKMSINLLLDKQNVTYPYNKTLFSYNKE